ncbi:MAG: type II toxin-antitoxin system VapC family toxin [Desulfobacula sp.]|uniref:type II toxin-antitoxin system VapC family toxin n=1 Tax=Desulfobacula sp. TaxID=2593537 RepID=UPI0025C20000|nr:type II toxin-antitoxin system VapC family toxin [Desulfobacula sp.]MCD4722893.1 type II toxin-antitoxin system VapC family toxin [Desulfobacula sp.]
MRICIDTNIYSAFKNGDKEIIELLENSDELLIPVVVLGELYAGFHIGSRLKENLKELDLFLNMPGVYTVKIDREIADRYGMLIKILKEQGTPIPTNDVWIAATALEKGTKLATFDTHFRKSFKQRNSVNGKGFSGNFPHRTSMTETFNPRIIILPISRPTLNVMSEI